MKWFLPFYIGLYVVASFLIVPIALQTSERVPLPITKSSSLVPHNFLTVILNRHYVKQQLFSELNVISQKLNNVYPNTKVVYLDANFPFIDGFPLLPHRSHDDGRKVDLSFIYSTQSEGTNSKPSRSGYGYYEGPRKGEYDQPAKCLKKGYWQYDFPKFLTLGTSDRYLFDDKKTKDLLQIILGRAKTKKVFIEPYLKTRLQIEHIKCRYHGCKAVRHDDHIHYQI